MEFMAMSKISRELRASFAGLTLRGVTACRDSAVSVAKAITTVIALKERRSMSKVLVFSER
jgi:hypothetical protein